MRLPNLSRAVKRWTQVVTWRKETQLVDPLTGMTKRVFSDEEIRATVQPASREILQTIGITDYSIERLWLHSEAELRINDRVIYKGNHYKVVNLNAAYVSYGYVEAIAEIIKNAEKL